MTVGAQAPGPREEHVTMLFVSYSVAVLPLSTGPQAGLCSPGSWSLSLCTA
jgi:hypothetical protein